jgi:hypothetical protein
MTTDWMKEPLRQPTQHFFDQRRLRELSTAGSETHRPTTSSASSQPPWGKLDGGITPRSRPSTSGNVWLGDEDRQLGPRHTGQEQDFLQSQKPVQLLPRYMVIREMRRENNGTRQALTPRLVVTPRYKPAGKRQRMCRYRTPPESERKRERERERARERETERARE